MAKTTAPLGSFSAHGKLANTLTYRTNKGQNIVSGFSSPGSYKNTRPSATQTTRRDVYSAGSRVWSSLYSATRTSFNTNAVSLFLTGFNLFLRRFLTLFSAGLNSITWTAQTTPNDNNYRNIAWSPELRLFAACSNTGTLNRIMTSPDGVNWTVQTTPNSNNYADIIWSSELRLFIAVAGTGTLNMIMTSPDGVNWTAQTTPDSNNNQGVAWSPELGLVVTVGSGGTLNRVKTSPILSA